MPSFLQETILQSNLVDCGVFVLFLIYQFGLIERWPDRGREFLEALAYSDKVDLYILQMRAYVLHLFMAVEREAIPAPIAEEPDSSVEIAGGNR
jgi:hypothetical protein